MINNLVPGFKTQTELQREAASALLEAGFTNLNPGSALWAIVTGGTKLVGDFYSALNSSIENSMLDVASGIWLDLIGQEVGIARLGTGTVQLAGVQKFMVPRGVLGDYREVTTDLTLGPGVQVTASGGTPPIWRVVPWLGMTEYPRWSRSDREVEVRIENVTQGTAANCGVNTLVGHNLPHSFIQTTNVRPIVSVQSPESDSSYRWRLKDGVLAKLGGTRVSLEKELMSLPEVDSVLVKPFVQGPGSILITIVPAKGRGGPEVLERAQALAEAVVAPGMAVYTRLARSRELRLSLRITISSGEATSMASQARSSVLDYLGRLGVGQPALVSALSAAVLDVTGVDDVQVLAVNLDGVSMPGQNVLIGADEILVVPEPAQTSIQVDVR